MRPGQEFPKNRCRGCWLVIERCVCGVARCHALPIGIVVVRHHKEVTRASNSARLVPLALSRSEIRDLDGHTHAVNLSDLDPRTTAVLFPEGAPLESGDHSALTTLVIPDGTWRQTRRMVRRNPDLAALPQVGLSTGRVAERVLQAPEPSAMSTLEAIGLAIHHLGFEEASVDLLKLYDAFASAGLAQRGGDNRPRR
jgi:DTW domain-containing protein YfiP